jgi:hypothetical protein
MTATQSAETPRKHFRRRKQGKVDKPKVTLYSLTLTVAIER